MLHMLIWRLEKSTGNAEINTTIVRKPID